MSKKDSYMNIPLKLQAFVEMTIISTRMLTEIKYLQWQFMKLYGFTRLWCSLQSFFLLETLQMNALSEMGVDYIDTEKEDSSQLSAQEAVVKSAKLGKKGQFIVQV